MHGPRRYTCDMVPWTRLRWKSEIRESRFLPLSADGTAAQGQWGLQPRRFWRKEFLRVFSSFCWRAKGMENTRCSRKLSCRAVQRVRARSGVYVIRFACSQELGTRYVGPGLCLYRTWHAERPHAGFTAVLTHWLAFKRTAVALGITCISGSPGSSCQHLRAVHVRICWGNSMAVGVFVGVFKTPACRIFGTSA